MINTLDDYIGRSLPEYEDFITNPNLCKKVNNQGQFLPYFGDTTVFLLSKEVKAQLEKLQQKLYTFAGWILAEPLQPSTFHMTLHDLVNGPILDSTLEARISNLEPQVTEILSQFQSSMPLRMRTTSMFNMVNTSIVLGLKPADEDSWQRLDKMYMALEQVLPLGYGLTPHITLGYYRPGCYKSSELHNLRNALRPVEMELELKTEDLVLQHFCDMNTYFPPLPW